MQITVTRDGQQYGPFGKQELRNYIAAGNFTADDLCWHDGLDAWVPVRDVLDLPPVPPPAFRPGAPSQVVSQPQYQQQQQTPANAYLLYESRKKSAVLACALNFFLPGVGYMYAGMWIIGILVALLFLICIPFTFGIGSGIIWFIGVIDGFLAVGRSNRKLADRLLRA